MEQWRDIPGYVLKYMVSDEGRVLSLCRKTWRFLRPFPCGRGHLRVLLDSSDHRYVHELMLTSFIGPRPDGMISRHLNGVRTNNVLANLEWSTESVNRRDVKYHGGNSRQLSVDEILEIKQSLDVGITRKELASKYDVSVSTIQAITNGYIHSEVLTYQCTGQLVGVIQNPQTLTNSIIL